MNCFPDTVIDFFYLSLLIKPLLSLCSISQSPFQFLQIGLNIITGWKIIFLPDVNFDERPAVIVPDMKIHNRMQAQAGDALLDRTGIPPVFFFTLLVNPASLLSIISNHFLESIQTDKREIELSNDGAIEMRWNPTADGFVCSFSLYFNCKSLFVPLNWIFNL